MGTGEDGQEDIDDRQEDAGHEGGKTGVEERDIEQGDVIGHEGFAPPEDDAGQQNEAA